MNLINRIGNFLKPIFTRSYNFGPSANPIALNDYRLDALNTPITTPLTPSPSPTASPTPTPLTAPQGTYGRTRKSQRIRELYPDRYNQAVSTIKSVGANPFETNLLTDIASAENDLKPTGVNYAWPQATAQGMFMFNNPTWGDYLKASPSAAIKGARQDDPVESARAALFEIRSGRLSRWDASESTWGKEYSGKELNTYYGR